MTDHRPLPDYVAVSPAGTPEPALAIAASRAGALGVVNLEFTTDVVGASVALTALAEHSHRPYGALLNSSCGSLLGLVLQHEPSELDTVVLTGAGESLQRAVEAVTASGRRAWVSVTDVEAARFAVDAGAGALIAKGHESGGWVGEETTFVLLQRLLGLFSLPVYAQGGIGISTGAACFAAGAAGVVLDNQLLLTRESPLPQVSRSRIAAMDGSETEILGRGSATFRAYSRAGVERMGVLRSAGSSLPSAQWAQEVAGAVDWRTEEAVWPLGQDAALAPSLAERFVTVGGVITGMRRERDDRARAVRRLRPLEEASPLAASHGTRYPIVQGPMTRVSDRATFAEVVAEGGALPFLALALLKAEDIRPLLDETSERLAGRPWGVGILGFVPPDLRAEQLEAVKAARPPFALIAGGQPHQARELEDQGIPTYLHVPSPGLLRMFLGAGARRFVFEGKECGGHIGPRTSFVLWESMIEILLEHAAASTDAGSLHVLFAGGVHDALSAHMVATMAAPLVDLGVKVGVLVGTAYVFTEEATSSGAIQPTFQKAAVDCTSTITLEAGPGYATRCLPSPFCETFAAAKQALIEEQLGPEELKNQLEQLNIGRLRVASKGIDRGASTQGQSVRELVDVGPEEQWRRGMYMIGQVAAFRNATTTVRQLHEEISAGSVRLAAGMRAAQEQVAAPPQAAVAIVGMSAILPGAHDLASYWTNVLNKVDAVTEVPADRWNSEEYFGEDRRDQNSVYSRWGGFIGEVPFDPVTWGMPPNSLESIEPFQLIALELVRRALDDAGYASRPFPRDRTSVIFGAGGGAPDLTAGYVVRSSLPALFGRDDAAEVARRLGDVLPEWTEDSFAGLLMNVAAGRVANRFDFGGVNCTVDAACASSLAAVYMGVRDLEAGTSDVVIVGGVDAIQNPFGYFCFSKTQALSPTGRSRPFDEAADGIAISEGFASVVLKRLEDAERDGDRIYAVIRGVGGSSDGKGKSLTAPSPRGQMVAFERAYAQAGFSPATVGLIEAHGTGTAAGDAAELESLNNLMESAGAERSSVAVGSVKSMIGHTKATAGVAGLVKAGKALYHGVLPPTMGVSSTSPNVDFEQSPLYINTECRPWVSSPEGAPRRAGVSAFGFGGTNFHVVLEEYSGRYSPNLEVASERWRSELLLLAGAGPGELRASVDRLLAQLVAGARPDLAALAYTLSLAAAQVPPDGRVVLALVCDSIESLANQLSEAKAALDGSTDRLHSQSGVHFSRSPLAQGGSLAFLFPGQGSQYVDMSRELAVLFPQVRRAFDEADRILSENGASDLSRSIFPPPARDESDKADKMARLTRTDVAQPALAAASAALLRLLEAVGIYPQMAGGHSFGELIALHAAGALSAESLLLMAQARGRCMAASPPGAMAAVMAAPAVLADLPECTGSTIANLNAPEQTVISGTPSQVEEAVEWCLSRGVRAVRLPVGGAFHSPLVASAAKDFGRFVDQAGLAAPVIPVFSNATALQYPFEPAEAAEILKSHLCSPVQFVGQIESMYQAGARLFLEVGPKQVLTGLAGWILDGKEHVRVSVDGAAGGLKGFLEALATLAAEGFAPDLAPLFRGRPVRILDLDNLEKSGRERYSDTTWMVSGAGVRPLNGLRRRTSSTVSLPLQAAEPPPTAASAPPVPAAIPASAAAGHDGVVGHFQRVMHKFLEVQESVMLASLGRAPQMPAISHDGSSPPAGSASPTEVTEPPLPAAPVELEPVEQYVGESPVPDRLSIAAQLLAIVSERTGYPAESLSLDADLEADLGLDSIKRVEIAGTVVQALNGVLAFAPDMEAMNAARSLNAMVDHLCASNGQSGPAPAPPPAAAVTAGAPVNRAPEQQAPVERFVVGTRPLPSASPGAGLGAGVVLIVDGYGPVADLLTAELAGRGHVAVRTTTPASGLQPSVPDHLLVLDGPDGVDDLVKKVHGQFGPVAALLDLGVLSSSTDPETKRMETFVTLAKALAPDLERSAATGGAVTLGCTRLGGTSGSGPAEAAAYSQAWRSGLLKSLAQEWPAVRVKVVDLAAGDPQTVTGQLMDEMFTADGVVEVGYDPAGSRWEVSLKREDRPLKASQPALDDRSVVLITGGARGITAEVALRLAAEFRSTLVLVGRTPAPDGPEDPATAHLVDEQELNRVVFERLRATGARVRPVDISAAMAGLRAERELRRNLDQLHRTGARIEYRACDVRDPVAFSALIEDVYSRFGHITGVIHGAGVIEDRLLADKDAESFRRVFDTKVTGALVLAANLKPETTQFFVLFSSISGRFGNRGQTDYAAANEVLNKLARELDGTWPGRVVSVNWGPWLSTGMVTEEAKRQLAGKGVGLIPVERGCEMLMEELCYGSRAEPEVVVASLASAPGLETGQPTRTAAGSSPLLSRNVSVNRAGPEVTVVREFDLNQDLYLGDHVIDGRSVVPFALATELMAEAAGAGWPGLVVTELTDIRVLRGIVMEGGPIDVLTTVRPVEGSGEPGILLQAEVTLSGDPRVHYRCRMHMLPAGRPIAPTNGRFGNLAEALPPPLSMDEVYKQWLFHGELFEAIESIERMSPLGATGWLAPSSPRDCLRSSGDGIWLVDPVLVDAAFQMQVVWARQHWGITILPSSVGRIRVSPALAPILRHRLPVRCELRIRPETHEPVSHTDFALYGADGTVVMLIEDLEGTGNAQFNRFAGTGRRRS